MFSIYLTFITAVVFLYLGTIWSRKSYLDQIVKTVLFALAIVHTLLGLKATGVL